MGAIAVKQNGDGGVGARGAVGLRTAPQQCFVSEALCAVRPIARWCAGKESLVGGVGVSPCLWWRGPQPHRAAQEVPPKLCAGGPALCVVPAVLCSGTSRTHPEQQMGLGWD